MGGDIMRPLFVAGLALEPQTRRHAAAMFEVLSDPAIYEFENEPPESERELFDRFAWLERRSSPDGRQRWLNWVIRLPEGYLAGYVQATVLPDSCALLAYEINSRYWRRGIATAAVSAMMIELAARFGVHTHVAVLKAANYRSQGLLRRLEFVEATPEQRHRYGGEADERVMVRPARERRPRS